MPRLATSTLALSLLAASLAACATPTGSNARPVRPTAKDSNLIGAGLLVPVYADGAFDLGSDDDGLGVNVSNFEGFLLPLFSYDRAVDKGLLIGAALSMLASPTDDSALALFLTPRVEVPIAWNDTKTKRFLSVVGEVTLGYIETTIRSNDPDVPTTRSGVPVVLPAGGLRFYIPTGDFGGGVITQQISVLSGLAFPGSFAWDFPLPLGDSAVLHLFPELRWDPVLSFAVEDGGETGSGIISTLSAGGSFMIEF